MAEQPAKLDQDPPEGASVAELTTEIVSAYVAHNSLATSDLARLIGVVAAELQAVGREPDPAPVKAEPAVPIRRSIQRDRLTCLDLRQAPEDAQATSWRGTRPHARRVPGTLRPEAGLSRWWRRAIAKSAPNSRARSGSAVSGRRPPRSAADRRRNRARRRPVYVSRSVAARQPEARSHALHAVVPQSNGERSLAAESRKRTAHFAIPAFCGVELGAVKKSLLEVPLPHRRHSVHQPLLELPSKLSRYHQRAVSFLATAFST